MKPKKTQKEDPKVRQERDFFQTPNYATDLLIPFLTKKTTIWECAAGNGKIADRIRGHGFRCFQTDIATGENFLDYIPKFSFHYIVTNPPFSLKRKFFERYMAYNKPFALLLPVDFCGWNLRAMKDEPELGWIIPTRRIDYITPTGRAGKTSAAQYHSGWLTYCLDLPRQITIVELSNEEKESNI